MNPKDILNIDSLFEDILEEQVVEKQVQFKLKEQERLRNLYTLNKNNIDDIYTNIIENQSNQFYIGKVYGTRTIIDNVLVMKNGRKWYKCKCECGQEILTRPDVLITNMTGCSNCISLKNAQRLIKISTNTEAQVGQVFGARTVIDVLGIKNKNNEFFVICKCECGSIAPVRYARLKRGKANRCSKCKKSGPDKKLHKR